MRVVSLCGVIASTLLSAPAAADPVTFLISGRFPVEGCASGLDHGTWVERFPRSLCGKSFQGYLTIDDVPTAVYGNQAEYQSVGYPYGLVIKVEKTRAYGFDSVRVQIRNDEGYGPEGYDYVNLSADLPNNGDTFFFSLFDFTKTAVSSVGGLLQFPDADLFQQYCLDNNEGCELKIGSGGPTTQDGSYGGARRLENLSVERLPYVIEVPPGLLRPTG